MRLTWQVSLIHFCMKVFILGGGGREHALGWKLAQSDKVEKLYFLPGNAGTAEIGTNLDISPVDISAILAKAKELKPELIVVGPEAPLFEGISDKLSAEGFRVFGVSQKAAMLEAEKSYAKEFLKRHSIPTAAFKIFTEPQAAIDYVKSTDGSLVIKASGPALGKGVILTNTVDEAITVIQDIMVEKHFGNAGSSIVIEEKLFGEEVSILFLTNGLHYVSFPPSQDHKQIGEGDTGLNTGGMGAYAPAPLVDARLLEIIEDSIIQPVLEGLQKERISYKGVMYIGLMITADGPKVLEFNCRFGDPETQPLMLLTDEDLAELFLDTTRGNISTRRVKTRPGCALCVIAASEGYPASYQKGKQITMEFEQTDNLVCFHAGTRIKESKLLTSGGRVLGITAFAEDLKQAKQQAYRPLEKGKITFDGIYYRHDIGDKGIERIKTEL